MNELYTNEKIDFTQEPLFFGQGKNLQRFDTVKYQWMLKSAEKMRSLFWVPQEISLTKDRNDFKNKLDDAMRFIQSKNVSRQSVLDSVQGRSPILTFGQLTNLPEFENCILNWDYFEGAIHSESYTYILQNVYDNIKDQFDAILDDPLISKHSVTITKEYNELYDLVIKYQADKQVTKELKEAVVKAMVSVNILEGIRFYVSFACSFSLAENNLMTGNAQILKLIARDENQHLALTQKLILLMKKSDEEGFVSTFKDLDEYVINMYRQAAEEEMEWADYLFQYGAVIGLNANILKDYVKYLTNRRLKAIGYPSLYEGYSTDPLPWMKKWLTESAVEGAPQEQESTDYARGMVDTESEVEYNFF